MNSNIFRAGCPETNPAPIVPPDSLPQADAPFTRPEEICTDDQYLTPGLVDKVAVRGAARMVRTDAEPPTTPPTAEFTRLTPPPAAPPPLPPAPVDSPDMPDKLSPVKQLIGPTESDTTLNERHPEWPPVKLHIHFGPHGKAEDLRALPGLIKEKGASVYCYEDVTGDREVGSLTTISTAEVDGSNPVIAERAVDIVKGDRGPIRGRPLEMQVRGILGTGIAIGHFDAKPGQGDPNLSAEYAAADKRVSELKDTLDDTLENILSAAEKFADLNAQRDSIMLGPTPSAGNGTVTAGRFEKEMERIFAERPELKDQPEVTVIDTHGAAHTSMHHRARAAGVDVERSFSDKPFTYNAFSELVRKIDVGKQPTKDFLGYVFVDEILRDALDFTIGIKESRVDQDITQYVRTRAATFDRADVERVHEIVKKDSRELPVLTIMTVNKILEEKGFEPIPWDRDEIRADIAKRAADLAQKKERIQAENEARRRTTAERPDK